MATQTAVNAPTVKDRLDQAGFTPAQRAAFYAATKKQAGDLTPYELALLFNYEIAKDTAQDAA